MKTNEEKAIEIAREHHAYCFSDAVSGAIEMAEWKRQTIQGKIERLV